jgi:hypothetical protein
MRDVQTFAIHVRDPPVERTQMAQARFMREVLPFNTRSTGFVCTPSERVEYGMVLALQGRMFSER